MPAQNPPARSRSYRAAWATVGVATVIRLVRDRRVQATVVAWGIGLAVLGQLSQDNRRRTLARLSAWDKRITERAQRQAQHVKREIKESAREITS